MSSGCSCTLLQALEAKRVSAEPARLALLKTAWMKPVPTSIVMAELYPGRCEPCWASSGLYQLAADALICAQRKINNYSDARCTKYRLKGKTMWLVVPAEIADHMARVQELQLRRKLGWL